MLAFMIKCKFSRNALHRKKKQTLILAGYKHATIDRLAWANIRFLKIRGKFCLFIR